MEHLCTCVQIESLEADKDISNEQLTTMKAKLDEYKEPNEDDVINNLKSMESDSDNDGRIVLYMATGDICNAVLIV